MTHNISEEEKILRRIPVEILVLSFVIALASLLLLNPLIALFTLAGGAFSALSFIWLKQAVSRLFLLKSGETGKNRDSSLMEKKGDRKKRGTGTLKKRSQSPFLRDRHLYVKNGDRHLKEGEPVPFFNKKKALRSALALYGIRLVLILAIFFIIIFFFSRNIIAFVAGFSTMIPVFLAEAVVGLSRMKQWKS
jgi:ABC-type multidrug transport system fused ATPase/permease subunit